MGKLIDRTGMRYGRLLVLKRQDGAVASNGARTKWICVCDCGTIKTVTGHELASGDSASCGCLRNDRIRAVRRSHGRNARDPTYMSWMAAKQRCYNPNSAAFAAYGGRGIEMCERWRHSFETFLTDMGERPNGKTLDRIDNERGYELLNCRWATAPEQSSNKRKNVLWQGRRLTIKALAKQIGVPRTSLNKLVRRGLSIEDAVQHAVARRK